MAARAPMEFGKRSHHWGSYTYRICDPDAIQNYSAENYHYFTKNLEHNGSLCYTMQMDFVNLITTDQNQIDGLIWVVQVQIIDDFTGDTRHSVFHVDSESFEVRSADTIHPDTIRYTKSIQNTLFSLHKYTASESKLLQTGVSWGEVTEYNDRGDNPDMKVMDKKTFDVSSYYYEILKQNTTTEQQLLDVFSVGYQIDIADESDIIEKENKNKDEENNNNVTNSFLVNSHLPFPVSSEYFNPSYIIEPQKEFEFELIKYLETKSNKPPIPIIIPIPDDSNDTPEDLPITITGTIELTFPDDPIPDDTIPDDPIPDDSTQSTQDDNSSLSVIVLLVIVLATAGLLIWKKPSFVGKDKTKKSQNITKTKISFDDKINLKIHTIPDTNNEKGKEINPLLSKPGE